MFAQASSFATVGQEATNALSRVTIRRSFNTGECIYMQDDEAKYLHVVQSGYVRLSYMMEDGSAVLHAILAAGETFGELGVFEQSHYPDMATAVGPVVTACIPVSSFGEVARHHPTLSRALSQAVANRYRSYLILTRHLSLKTLSARLAQALLRLADGFGLTVVHEGRPVNMIGAMVTQTDLGLMARGSRGNVNRALKAWERAGWIASKDRCILITDRASLETVATEEGL